MLALARHPNIGVKMSGAPSYSSQPYPYKNIHGYLRQIFEAFGPDRSFWGTDIPRMPCSYRQCVTMFTEELPWLKGRDLERVMGGAVIDWLGWKRPAAWSHHGDGVALVRRRRRLRELGLGAHRDRALGRDRPQLAAAAIRGRPSAEAQARPVRPPGPGPHT